MKIDAIFRLASMTKPIVSVAAMMLVEEGKLDLLAPVSKYLPEFKDLKVGVEQADIVGGKRALTLEPQRRPMTVQDLLRHTSGLVYGQNGDDLVHQAYRDAKVGDRDQTPGRNGHQTVETAARAPARPGVGIQHVGRRARPCR